MNALEQAGKIYAEMVWPTVSDEHKVLISFGMIDVSIVNTAGQYFKKMLCERYAAHYQVPADKLEAILIPEEYKKLENQFQHGVYVQMLQLRKQEGLMVC